MWRILEISGDNYFLHVQNQNLRVEKDGHETPVAFADIHSIVCHGSNTRFSEEFFRKCIEYSIPVTFCDEKHVPSGMLLPYQQHSESFSRMNGQLDSSVPRRKQAWQAIIKTKIAAQSFVLGTLRRKEVTVLDRMATHVLSGDVSHVEGQAARLYFSSLFGTGFTRRDDDGINALLNYGYSIIRSCVARGVVCTGLNPSLGIFHSPNRNAFCLVDDLMEPLRPIVDRKVCQLIQEGELELTPTVKKELIALSLCEVEYKGQNMELTTAVNEYVMSYFNFITGAGKRIDIPHQKV